MKLKRVGTLVSMKGPEACFSGRVREEMLSNPPAPARTSCASVMFGPGARSGWHTHPFGQTLIITAGRSWTQREGEPIVEIRAGDVIWCPLGHKHWHGAALTTGMTHIAVQVALDGVPVVWLEKVTDAEFLIGSSAEAHAHQS